MLLLFSVNALMLCPFLLEVPHFVDMIFPYNLGEGMDKENVTLASQCLSNVFALLITVPFVLCRSLDGNNRI